MKKCRKHVAEIKKQKRNLMETSWNFVGSFEETSEKLYETSNNFREKSAEEPLKNFGNIWGVLENLSGGASRALTGRKGNTYAIDVM